MPGQIIPLTDDELLSVADDPELALKFTSEERRRLRRLRGPGVMTRATEGMIGQSTDQGDPGFFEDRGMAGARWHPPTGDGSERTRPDASLLGMPPELAVMAPLSMGRAVAAPGLTMAGRAMAGVKAAAPALKYEATKTGLEAVGVPPALATTVALAVSGTSARRPSIPRPRKAATSPPVAETPAAPAPEAAPAAPASAPPSTAASRLSPQRIRNEVGLAARREQVTLTETQLSQADDLVATQGMSARDAVRQVAAGGSRTAQAAQKAKLTAETDAYLRLRQAGKTHEEAVTAVQQMRDLSSQLGTPSSEAVRQSVAQRNATGRWPTP